MQMSVLIIETNRMMAATLEQCVYQIAGELDMVIRPISMVFITRELALRVLTGDILDQFDLCVMNWSALGADVVRQIKRAMPSVRICALGETAGGNWLVEALDAGANITLPKDPEQMFPALKHYINEYALLLEALEEVTEVDPHPIIQ
ncbi:hypothetical protein D4R52_01875 [bacterium]|nr:MAG: hypothetical protein D4R52_01875 [bacterium]